MSEDGLDLARRRRNGKVAACEACRKVSRRDFERGCPRYPKLNHFVGRASCDVTMDVPLVIAAGIVEWAAIATTILLR